MLKINLILAATYMVVAVIGQWEGAGDLRKFRKWQMDGLSARRLLRKKLDARLMSGMHQPHRQRVEVKLLQAGFKLHYHEFVVICILFAVAGGAVGRTLNNTLLTLVLPLLGLGVPWQLLKLIRHRRQAMIYRYIGSALKMWAERIILTKDIAASLEFTTAELEGEEPLYSEFRSTLADIEMGMPLREALRGLTVRVDNRFLARHIENALLAEELGTRENRQRLLAVACRQAEERERNVAELNKQLAAPRLIFSLFVAVIPPLFFFMSWGNPGYFMYLTQNTTGQKIMSGAVLGMLVTLRFFSRLAVPVDD